MLLKYFNYYLQIAIKDYDFEFNRFPVEFTAEGQINQNNFSELLRRIKSGSFNPFYEILGGIFAYSFGIRVTYPGSTALMNLAIGFTCLLSIIFLCTFSCLLHYTLYL